MANMNIDMDTENFHNHRRKAMEMADQMCSPGGIKSIGYNSGGITIRTYLKYASMRVMAHSLYTKALRAISLTSLPDEGSSLSESLEDTCLDVINHAAFMYAEIQCRREETRSKP